MCNRQGAPLGAAQYSPYSAPAEQHLPAPGVVPHGLAALRLDTSLTVAECRPGTWTNNGGKGQVCPKSAKPCPSHGSWAKCGRWNSSYHSKPKNRPISHCSCNIGAIVDSQVRENYRSPTPETPAMTGPVHSRGIAELNISFYLCIPFCADSFFINQ